MTVSHGKRRVLTQATLPVSPSASSSTPVLQYTCDSCHRDISSVVRVVCVHCPSPIDLCVGCLAEGREFLSHRSFHSYQVVRPFDFPVYENPWRADEELVLLEAIESSGMGNWTDIAEQVGSKSAYECEKHYCNLYLNWKGRPSPNPAMTIGLEGTVDEHPAKHPRIVESPPSKLPVVTSIQSVPANHEIAGYMPLRHEFETEAENDAELSLKDLAFTAEDSSFDTSLKLALLHAYSGVLDRRQARRDFIKAHGLLEFKKHQAIDKGRGKDERDLYNILKPFARFIAPSEFEKFFAGLYKEHELCRRIALLQEYRRMGLRTWEVVQQYENDKKHLDLYLKGGGIISRKDSSSHRIGGKPRDDDSDSIGSSIRVPLPPPSSRPTTPSALSSAHSLPPSTGRKASAPLNISHADGLELLSEKERHLCSILRLYPRHYLVIKETLVREYMRLGGLKRAQARAAVKIDVNKTSKLYDFFVAAGWIRPPASGE